MICATMAHPRDITATLNEILRTLAVPDGPGAAVMVIRDGATLYKSSAGFADVEARVPNTPATHFRLASVSKQFTAAAVLLLVDEGRFSLDTRLTDIFPGFPTYGRDVTVRHLLTHTSGLPDYEDHMPPGITVALKDVDVLAILASRGEKYFFPGTQYRYSNSAYALLALAVEKYSGQRFPDFLAARIFRPLGMTHAVAHEEGITRVADRAFGYSPAAAGGYERTDQSLTSAVLGDGGIYASVEELARWDRALYEGRVLRPETQRLAFTSAVLSDGKPIDYGFGWRVGTYRGHRFVGHSGDSIGFRTHIERYVDLRLTVIGLFNRADVEPHDHLRRIADACIDSLV